MSKGFLKYFLFLSLLLLGHLNQLNSSINLQQELQSNYLKEANGTFNETQVVNIYIAKASLIPTSSNHSDKQDYAEITLNETEEISRRFISKKNQLIDLTFLNYLFSTHFNLTFLSLQATYSTYFDFLFEITTPRFIIFQVFRL
ncbi:MAG: hypothetical protein DWP98_06475 [Bacteroidetes bacterium]|nr:MAG: hypothetical protein DWP98_06475 [Bacteroidota bacterium]MBL1144478.1 hypothetical protein [Bacteroidota bacterium]